MLDLVVRGGDVVDGTGAPRRRADVGIVNGRIVEMGVVDGPARRTIDASGRVVTPGIVDVHTHLDAQLFWDATMSPSPLHGVTTAFAGNCGFTIAPLTPDAGSYLMPMLARVEGMPLEALAMGVPWDWSSTSEYFERVVQSRMAVNAGFMVGHSAIRRVVMGEAANQRAASQDEIVAMSALLRAGLAAGGMGFSSTWSKGHTDADGNPVPSRLASIEELTALAAVCRDFDGTSLEFIPATTGNRVFSDDDIEALTRMSSAAGRPINWNLLRVERDNTVVDEKLEVGTTSLERGGRVVALCLPEPLQLHLSFLNGVLLDVIDGWAETMNLPVDERRAALADPERRRQLAASAAGDAVQAKWTAWGSHVVVETFTPATKRYEGRTVGDIAVAEGKDPFDALLDIVVADGLRTSFRNGDDAEPREVWENRAAVCRDRRVIVGGSDAGAHLDMIDTHAYATRALANFSRKHQVMSFEETVHLLTGAPSALYGLRDRGLLALGYAADVVVMDEDSVDALPVKTRFDLPGGAGRLVAEAIGIDHVIVNGEEIVQHGEFTDARPGRLLRSGVDTTTAER